MIVVNKKNQTRTIDLIDFYEIKGLINTLGLGLAFDWRKDHGVIIGLDYTKTINDDLFNQTQNFENLTILRKWDYDLEKCTTKYLNPCPYYYGALSSLLIPTALAIISFFVMTCCNCCTCCCMKGT